MSQPVIEPRDDERSDAAARVVSTFFAFVLFAAGLALFTVAFSAGDAAMWLFFGGIVAIALAFAIPTTIVPALEDR